MVRRCNPPRVDYAKNVNVASRTYSFWRSPPNLARCGTERLSIIGESCRTDSRPSLLSGGDLHLGGKRILDGGQGRLGTGGFGATRLRHVGTTPAALAAERLCAAP